MENKLPTAEEFLDANTSGIIDEIKCEELMIEFAKLHVEEALKAASEEAKVFKDLDIKNHTYGMIGVNIDSILNAYPLTLIK